MNKPNNTKYSLIALVILTLFFFSPLPNLTPIEQTLFEMHLNHRMKAFQGAFHMNPDYSIWYGWGEMIRDLANIKQMAKQLRAEK